MFSRIRSDIQCILDRDPAARSTWEVITCYPGLHAVVLHRPAHWFWNHGFQWLGRFISHLSRFFTGIEIHPGAKLGERVFFDHAMGTVVGETAEIGDGCTIYQGVTLGGTSLEAEKRHPTIGDHVLIGAGAKVLGPVVIGAHSSIGANAVVVRDVPANSTVVGVPGRIASREGRKVHGINLDHTALPDPLTQALEKLQHEIDKIEGELKDFHDDQNDPKRKK